MPNTPHDWLSFTNSDSVDNIFLKYFSYGVGEIKNTSSYRVEKFEILAPTVLLDYI